MLCRPFESHSCWIVSCCDSKQEANTMVTMVDCPCAILLRACFHIVCCLCGCGFYRVSLMRCSTSSATCCPRSSVCPPPWRSPPNTDASVQYHSLWTRPEHSRFSLSQLTHPPSQTETNYCMEVYWVHAESNLTQTQLTFRLSKVWRSYGANQLQIWGSSWGFSINELLKILTSFEFVIEVWE